MPRLLYGLEITTLKQNEIQKLEIYLKKLLLKQVQNLPERTANEATYLMMGVVLLTLRQILSFLQLLYVFGLVLFGCC
jgi:hypothetical protein